MAERLLLVESDSTLCGQLSRFLTTLGYQVDAVESVGAALASLRAHPPALTLLAAQLEEDPATVAFATRQCDAGLIIMGRPEVADALVIDIGVEVAPDRVLHKPFTAQGLSDIVRAAIKERDEKAEAERMRAKASSELDAQLGALQAALGELTGMKSSAAPKPVATPDLVATPEPFETADLIATPDMFGAHDLRAALEMSAPPEMSTAYDPSASDELSAALNLGGGPEPDAAPDAAPDEPVGSRPLVDASHDLLAAGPRPSQGPAARGSQAPLAEQASRSSVAPGASGALGPLLDASALPAPPLESMELISQFALRPMAAVDPLDPRGIYGRVTMPELLYFCFRDLFSGWLLLRRGAVTKTVLLRGGRPVFAQSNIKAETLGTMLVSAGRLSPEDSERSLRYADALGIRQGEAIVRLGMLSEEGLRDGLRVQLSTRLTNCFSWSDAEYGLTYDPDAKEASEAAELNPLVVIFEGVRTRYPIAPLMAHYDQLIRQAPRATPRLADYATMLRAYRDELAVGEACDGTRALGDVLATSPFGLIGTLRIMRALESMNCLTYGSVVSSTAKPRAAAGPRRDSGGITAGVRSARRSSPDSSGARAGQSADPRTSSGDHRTLRPSERTSTGSHRALRPTGAHSAGIRKAGTRRPGADSDAVGSASRGPASRGAPSRGPGSRGPGSRGPASRKPSSAGAAQRPVPRTTGGRAAVPEQAQAESPAEMLDRIEAAEHSYAVLGVAPTANRASISNAASRLMRTLMLLTTHEDAEIGRRAKAAIAVVKTAGEALTNPQRRRAYDALNLPIAPASGTDLVAAESDFKLGRICLASNAMDRARSYFERAAKQDPHQAIYQVYLAWATFSLASDRDRRVRTQAVELAREALKSDSSRDDGHVLLGRMYQALASHDQAVRAFNKALEINSGNVDARTGIQQLEADQAETKKDTGLFGGLFSRR